MRRKNLVIYHANVLTNPGAGAIIASTLDGRENDEVILMKKILFGILWLLYLPGSLLGYLYLTISEKISVISDSLHRF